MHLDTQLTSPSRVCQVRLFGHHKFDIKQQKYKVSNDLKEGQAKVLFGESPDNGGADTRLHC